MKIVNPLKTPILHGKEVPILNRMIELLNERVKKFKKKYNNARKSSF